MQKHPERPDIFISSKEEERRRLKELYSLHLVDSEENEAFDRISALVADIFDVPTCLISIITEDRQWLKSCVGADFRESDRKDAFCQHVVANKETMVVPDAYQDDRFHNNIFVTKFGYRFYAGAELVTSLGNVLGTLCVLDYEPRDFSEEETERLEKLARWVVSEIELRYKVKEQEREQKLLEKEITRGALLQEKMLPQDYMSEIVDIESLYLPFAKVSGDLYDYKWVAEDRLFLYVADVMGHGVATALQTSAVRVLFSQALDMKMTLKETVEWVNVNGAPFMPEGYYFTAICCELDFRKQEATTIGAGINHLYHYQEESGATLHKIPGPMLGITDAIAYKEQVIPFKEGDVFLFFSDGLTEGLKEQGVWNEDELTTTSMRIFDQVREARPYITMKDDVTSLRIEIKRNGE
ncbi:SpoIIE family protein phosphatase [Salimicrobium halophilum]|uniref:Serine phosphatase RsbU, regulator of sigma subunit n=1 Tax=Salimicrobium halophilum TaxID=86666 RepID=A0A1G8T569_9BACI|nr:SpoIIE family protein phosphatase [Salimicrobium halophilum]SDJ36551.1 Serine phosphatase RsbU, regulator of sigma subunit [Salimicrobium halophilum]